MPLSTIDDLNKRFAIPGVAQITTGNGGLAKVEVTAPSASAEIYLHGAQLTSWQPAGSSEVIFVSRRSRWEDGKAIRGGIPVCFPWFRGKADDSKAPAHGFARTRSWELASIAQSGEDIIVALAAAADDASRQWWPYDCQLQHRITVGSELQLELIVTNTGSVPFLFEEALHTYHSVSNVESIRVAGLDGVAFLDNQDGNRQKLQQGDLIFTKATDNAYLNTAAPVEIIDPGMQRCIRLDKHGSLSTVTWNPWKEFASALSDLGDDEWRQMVCVEASNILGNAVTLAPGATHTMTAVICVTPG